MADTLSQYSRTPLFNPSISNTPTALLGYLDIYVDVPIPPDDSDSYVTIDHTYNGRPDLFAQNAYGTSRLWWVFMKRNMGILVDGWADFLSGTSIWVPTKQRVLQITGSNSQSGSSS